MTADTTRPRPSDRVTLPGHGRSRTHGAARHLLAMLAIALLLATGCTSRAATEAPVTAPPPAEPPSDQQDPSDRQDTSDDLPTAEPEATEDTSDRLPGLVARTSSDLQVFEGRDDLEPSAKLPATTGFGSTTTLLVLHLDDAAEVADSDTSDGAAQATADGAATLGWAQVLLPVRPNGSTGWIRTDDVELLEVDVEVVVDLTDRELTVVAGDDVLLTTAVAIGDADHPTPTGQFFVTDKLDTGDADGPYGPFALGLSGFSDVLTEFAGGEGQIGIHGTNDPDSIGEAASKGCVRVPNDVAIWLAEQLPLGTPVLIQ